MGRFSGFALAILVAVMLAIFGTTPPSPAGKDSSPTSFSAERAMDDVKVIAREPHPAGSPANAEVRSYIAERMLALGMEVSSTSGPASEAGTKRLNKWSGRNDPVVMLTNVMGVLPGKDPSLPAVLLMAHHDTVWGSPGAADDTAGVASALETVRAVKAQGQPQRDLIVLITDGEELGLEGAKMFFASARMRFHVGAVINMEARGGGGRATLFQTSRNNGNAVRLFAGAASRPGGSSLAAFIYSVLPNDTDLTPALKGPYAAYNFAFIGRSGLYHSPSITPERLDQGALQDMGGQVLALTQALLAAPEIPAPAPDTVFFDVFGLFLLTYPAWLGWVMLGVTGVALVILARREPSLRALSVGAGRMAALILLTGVLAYAFNLVSGAGAGANYYDRLAAIPLLEVMIALIAVGAALLTFGGDRAGAAGQAGAALPLALIGTAMQALAPTAAYFVVLPVMLAVLAMITPSRMVAVAVAALVVGYMLVLGHLVMQGVGPTMPMAAALPVAVAVLALLPLWNGLPKQRLRLVAGAALALALATALWVRVDPTADTIAVYSDNKR